MSTQLTPPRVIKIYLVNLIPIEQWGIEPFPNQPWRFSAVITVDPTIHSDMRTPRPGIYNGLDVEVGDFITTQLNKLLKITNISYQTGTELHCTLEDIRRLNSSVDLSQTGESSIQLGQGILFTAPNGQPLLFPLPGSLSQINAQDLVSIIGRFFYTNPLNISEVSINIDGGTY